MQLSPLQPQAGKRRPIAAKPELPLFSGAQQSALASAARHSAEAADDLVTKVKWAGFSKKLANIFNRTFKNPEIWGFSLEDWASRLNVAVAVYFPALLFSCFPDLKHFWETNGRNVLLWFATLGITRVTKDPKIGLNPLVLDKLMQEKARGSSLTPMTRVLNKLRPDFDFHDVFKAAELKDAEKLYWGGLDKNQKDKIQKALAESADKIKVLQAKPIAELSQADRLLLKLAHAPSLFNRISAMKTISTLVQMGLTVYLIGVVAMEIVFRYIAPRDKDFDASKYEKMKAMKRARKMQKKLQKQSLPPHAPASFNQPRTFESLFRNTVPPNGLAAPVPGGMR
jgi:hypothetical protein